MAAPVGQPDSGAGLLDLEKELSCSICTDILYRPLTLLDCLHTFCGSCLKEWFSWQHANATTSNPYTCPSCRASVRGTKHNATVNTLLDMFLQANPGRARSAEERAQIDDNYKPGDDILPKVHLPRSRANDDDRALLHQVQELSLREVGIANDRLDAPRDRRRRERSRDRRDRDGRSRRTRDNSASGQDSSSSRAGLAVSPQPSDPARHVEHQSSLRSLLSASEVDSHEIEEEIMRQIVEEGLLDGIDLNNITVEREDEISERIAQAYRRRQRERRQAREAARREQGGGSASNPTSPPLEREERSSRRPRERPERLPPQQSLPSRPPASSSQLTDAAFAGPPAHGRSSSQGNNHTLHGLAVANTRQASRSVSDLSEQPTALDLSGRAERRRPRRLSQNDRSITDPERQRITDQWRGAAITSGGTVSNPNSPRRAAFPLNDSSRSQPSTAAPLDRPTTRRRTEPTSSVAAVRPVDTATGSQLTATPESQSPPPVAHSSTDPILASSNRSILYPEPQIDCRGCGKPRIQYDLHYNCAKCEGGNYNLCLRCYRLGKGCLHWYGFGYAARIRYERQAPPGGYPPDHEPPHVLSGHRYLRPGAEITRGSITNAFNLSTNEDPAKRLQAGVFCAICLAFANACYWKCDFCNEGEWGFCNDCVNQGRHCTHPLLPVSQNLTSQPNSTENGNRTPPPDPNSLAPGSPTASTPPLTPKSASLLRGSAPLVRMANLLFRPLTFTTECDICHYPIPPSHTRFHCQNCNNGDYDICTPCYQSLVSNGRISFENGPSGWRRCLKGHRMCVIGFEDRDGGQRRVVTKDLVGGVSLKEDSIPTASGEGSSQPSSGPRSPPLDGSMSTNWKWREVDGTVRRARTATGTQQSGTVSPSGPGTSTPSGIGAGMANSVAAAIGQTVFPPDGGGGLKVLALWSYYPAEGVADELMFPKYAEIREAENINGDWFWGVYAGAKGLFPGNYGKVL